MIKKPSKRIKEQGNVLWLILIGVALLSALTIVLSKSGSNVDQSGNVEQQRVKISQLLRSAKSIEAALQEMRLRGVSENDISFWNDSNNDGTEDNTDTYFNANCTIDDCHVFNAGGGGLRWPEIPNGMSNASDWIFNARNIVDRVGDNSRADLIMILPQIRSSTCTQINRMLNVTFAGTESGVDFDPFDGGYNIAQTIDIANAQEAGCIEYNTGTDTEPFFYYVLVKR